jgi:hypothetical protein
MMMSPLHALVFFSCFAGLAVLIWLLALVSTILTDSDTDAGQKQRSTKYSKGDDLREIRNAIESYSESRKSQERHRGKREKLTIVALGAAAVFAAIAGFAAIWSALVFQEQLAEMRKVYDPINDQALAAKEAANAARTSATTAERALIASQRPWVDIIEIEVADDIMFDTNGARIALGITLLNRGHSPALKIFPWDSAYLPTEITGVPNKKFAPPMAVSIDMERPSILFPDVPTPKTVSSYVWTNQIDQ